jgi:Fe-S cluster assembly protein SufD
MASNAAPEAPFIRQFTEHRDALSRICPSWMSPLREKGAERFREEGFPGPTVEAWRFTSLKRLGKTEFLYRPLVRAEEASAPGAPGRPDLLRDVSLVGETGTRLAFVNGGFSKDLSAGMPGLDGLILRDLAGSCEGEENRIQAHLGQHLDLQRHRFAALNTAFLAQGAFVRVARGVALQEPIHLLFSSFPGGEPRVSHPRVLVLAEEGSQVTILEEYVGDAEAAYFTNAVTEILVGPNASVTHVKLGREGKGGSHIGLVSAVLDRDGRFASHCISMGGRLARTDIDVVLREEGSECTLNGLYLVADRQHVDHHTLVDHASPHTRSGELYKGVLDDKATAVFNGRVVIRPRAQKVEAGQSNNNLLLSKEALVNTNPELEIFADDVKAQHGATVGQLNEDHLFYLRSRGLAEEEARQLLIFAFAGEMIDRVPHDGVRERLASMLNERF